MKYDSDRKDYDNGASASRVSAEINFEK